MPAEQQLTVDPQPDAPSAKTRKQRSMLRDLLETALIALLIFISVRSVVLNFEVNGDSMLPSLVSGQRVLASRVSYGQLDAGDLVDWIPGVSEQHWLTLIDCGEPQRGDIVVLTPPEPGMQIPHIKRVIGLAGDHVQIADGVVIINGIALDEPYTGDYESTCSGRGAYPICDVTVPEGSVFVMGDHRSDSSDSRFFGVVPLSQSDGRAVLVYWPLGDIHRLSSPSYPGLHP